LFDGGSFALSVEGAVGSPRISASLGILAGILEMVARRAVRNTNSAVSLLLDTILHLISRTALLGYATQLAFERCWADTSVVRRNLERRAARRSSIGELLTIQDLLRMQLLGPQDHALVSLAGGLPRVLQVTFL
jgi:hypothetical protein